MNSDDEGVLKMAIDARVEYVKISEGESGELVLIDRPAKNAEDRGIRGQSVLKYDTAPYEVTALNGLDVWGSNGLLMLGDAVIARRVGYTHIVFCDSEAFKSAVARYHRRRAYLHKGHSVANKRS